MMKSKILRKQSNSKKPKNSYEWRSIIIKVLSGFKTFFFHTFYLKIIANSFQQMFPLFLSKAILDFIVECLSRKKELKLNKQIPNDLLTRTDCSSADQISMRALEHVHSCGILTTMFIHLIVFATKFLSFSTCKMRKKIKIENRMKYYSICSHSNSMLPQPLM